jgi:hypothetical protein
MPHEPLTITLDGVLLEQARAAAAAEGLTTEEWVVARLSARLQRDREARASAQQTDAQD